VSDRPDTSPDSKRIIDELTREIERLRVDIERVEREKDRLRKQGVRLQRERDRLRRRNEKLKKQLDSARRAGFRQAAPFSRGKPKRNPERPGRKAGKDYGRKGHRRKPRRIDEHIDAPLPSCCPDCGGSIHEEHIAAQYQEDIPRVRPITRQFNVHIGRCKRCGRRVQGRHGLQTSDALGAASAQIGPQAVALAAFLNKQLGLSFGKIMTMMRDRFGLRITRGGLVQAIDRAARRAEPSYTVLCETVRGSPMVAPDETGWKVGGELWWLHGFATPDTTVYSIAPGRGFEEAAAVLSEEYAGTLVRDGWAPYRRFTRAEHQSCLAHLLRRCEHLIEDHPQALLPREVKALLKRALALRERFIGGEISERGLAVGRGRIQEAMVRVIESPGVLPAVVRFAGHLTTEFTALFSFLFEPDLDATNWRAEQALRPAVITRKVNGGGNRTERGARTQQVLASVLRTGVQRNRRADELLVPMLLSPGPCVPRALRPPLQ